MICTTAIDPVYNVTTGNRCWCLDWRYERRYYWCLCRRFLWSEHRCLCRRFGWSEHWCLCRRCDWCTTIQHFDSVNLRMLYISHKIDSNCCIRYKCRHRDNVRNVATWGQRINVNIVENGYTFNKNVEYTCICFCKVLELLEISKSRERFV